MLTRLDLQKMKQEKQKISMITAYDYPTAKTVEQAGVDVILVGDSLGMVVLGYTSTVQVTVNDMIHHAKAVKRGAKNTFMVVDMPFMSYHISLEDSLNTAKRIFQETNAQAVKLEGAEEEQLTLTRRLTDAGIPVVAHLGLTPQTVNVLGGFKVQGKDKMAGEQLLRDAKRITASGAIMLVLECVPKELAKIVTNAISIPTIGIGGGVHCDGQVLVYHDILNYGVERLPKFVKSYADLNTTINQAIGSYVSEVKEESFPKDEHSFTINSKELLPDENSG